jgi:predicted transcriptional regulator of viral defense system
MRSKRIKRARARNAAPRPVLRTVGRQTAKLLAALHARSQTTFNLKQVQSITGLTPASARSLLRKAANRGLVSRLKPGLFILIPQEVANVENYTGDHYLLARQLAGDAPYFLSYSSAMELHRMVTQPRFVVYVSTSKRIPNRTIHGTEFRFIYVKSDEIFGTMPHWINKQEKVVTSDLERTVVDGLRRPGYCGGIVEVAKGLWMRNRDLQVAKLVEYAVRLRIGAVRRRLGYLLELYGLATQDQLAPLRAGLTRTYDTLDPTLPKEGPYLTSWRLRLNVPAEELDAARRT